MEPVKDAGYRILVYRQIDLAVKEFLGVDPGSVTIFALVNDPDHSVDLSIDKSQWEQEAFQFHPLVNTSTLFISKKNLKRFLAVADHEVRKLAVPLQKS